MSKTWLVALYACLTLTACNKDVTTMNDLPATSPLPALFAKTKPVCFGRFVINVPEETQVVWGRAAFAGNIEVLVGEGKNIRKIISDKEHQILSSGEPDPEINESRKGDIGDSYILAFWEDKYAKRVGLESIWTYIVSQNHVFVYMDATGDGETRQDVLSGSTRISSHLRARAPDEVPTEPGVCLDHGFIADASGKYQEIFQIGFRFPSLPGVSFSVSSNKNAQRDPPLTERAKKLSQLVKGTEYEAGLSQLKVLHEGKRQVGRWQAEELLHAFDDKAEGRHQEFMIESQGVQYDKDQPLWNAQLQTGVVGNRAGGQASSLSDKEAMALWNTLLNSLRLRVE